jgi:hypothetical protein
MAGYLEFIIGAVFVGLYSIDRINTPKINLETTTVQRFWAMVLAYALASIVLFLLLAQLLKAIGVANLLAFLPGINDYKNMSPPLLMALFMTVLLPKIPGLATLDEAVRREFRHRASMSRIAGNLSHLLERGPLNLSAAKRDRVMQDLQEQEIESQDIVFSNNGSPQYLWTKISVLLDSLKNWETDPVYRGFVTSFRGEWNTLIEESELHEAKAIRCFRLGCVSGKDEKLLAALKDCRRHYSEQLTELLKKLSDFMGRGVAQCRRSPEARREALVAIGIDVKVNVGYTVHQITLVFLLALGVTILFPLLLDVINKEFDFKIELYMFKIAFSYACAGLVALHLHYRMDRPSVSHRYRPWGRYVVAGLIAVVLASLASLAIDALGVMLGVSKRNLGGAITNLAAVGWIYQLRTLVLAILLSYWLDTPVSQPRLRQRQWFETAVTAVIMAGAGLVILDLLNSNPQVHYAPETYRFLFSSLLLGTMVGYWLPTSARQTAERAPATTERQIESSPAAVIT